MYNIALQRGQAMRGLGITIDFAPVVDVTDAPDDTVIGDRSFGADPTAVTDYAGAYARGLRDAGLLPVLKHFPGHGHGSGDSHTGGVVTPPIADLQNNDLIPYRTLTTQAPVGVMVGHMQVPGLTGSDPASLSPAAYALLRSGDYGGPPFNGPVFTDDLSSMQAITDRFGVAEAALRGLQAGADIALWVTTDEVPAVLDRLEKALAAGELTMPAGGRFGAADGRGQGPESALRRLIRALHCLPWSKQSVEGARMAGGTKRLPRAVREQQMLDAAVQMFSVNGYHETSMDAIAAEAQISKPMLYLYYGSKEELFGACLDRELTRFVDDVRKQDRLHAEPKRVAAQRRSGVPELHRREPGVVDGAVHPGHQLAGVRPHGARGSRADHRAGRQAADGRAPVIPSPTPTST